jgi:hypothetical protein
MSEPQGNEVVVPPVVTEPQSTGHPAWEEALAELPEGLRPLVTPTFEKWDKGVQERLAKEKEIYAPWKELIDAQVDPAAAAQALNLMQAIDNDPAGVIKVLQEAYGLTKAEAKAVVADVQQTPTGEELSPEAKRIAELEARLNEVATGVQAQTKAQQDAKNAQDLRVFMDNVKAKFPTVPEQYLLPYVAQGLDVEKAAKDYLDGIEAAVQAAKAPGDNAPVVMGSGGGTVTNQQDLTKLSEKERKDLAIRMLEEASRSK